jgi:hypothetical protein
MQMWLHIHFICMRCNQLELACEHFRRRYPARGDFNTDPNDVPVQIDAVVGTTGWYLRDCAIIDWLGLNDWVVARTQRSTDPKNVPLFDRLAVNLPGADTDRSGFLDEDELARWIGSFFTAQISNADAEPVVHMALDLFANERSAALTIPEATAFLRSLFARGAMAHERVPPPGYIDAFERNVVVDDGRVTVTPRTVPLKPRLRAIENEWRDKGRRGQLRAP